MKRNNGIELCYTSANRAAHNTVPKTNGSLIFMTTHQTEADGRTTARWVLWS